LLQKTVVPNDTYVRGVTLNNASDYQTDGLYWTPKLNPIC